MMKIINFFRMKKRNFNKIFSVVMVFIMFFSNLPYEIISQTLKTYEESRNIVDKFYDIKKDSNVVDNLDLFELAKRFEVSNAEAASTTNGTTWYLSNTNASTAYGTTGPVAEYATATDISPTIPTLKTTAKAMTDTPGTSAVTVGGLTGTGVAWYRTFLSPKLAAQSIAAGMIFNLKIVGTESSTSANAFTRTHVYVWREGFGRVSTLIDGTAANCVTALEYATSGSGRACTTSAAAAATLQDGDQIAVEVWVNAVTGYTKNILYGGPTFVNHNIANTTPMSSFSTSRVVQLQTATTNGTLWFLSNTNALTAHGTTGPTTEQATATDVTPAVPTLKSTALAMKDTPGAATVTVGGLAGSGTTWYRTFLSPKLAAQSIASGMTFNLNLSGTESNAAANAFTRTHVYVWREGFGRVSTLIDGTAANCVTALEYITTGNGRSCVTGAAAAATLQDGDQIAVEVWVQAVNGYTVNILFNGPAHVNHSVANTTPMSFFATSRALILQTAVIPTVTLSNFVGSEPGNFTIAPGASAQVDSFGIVASAGTDTLTNAVVTMTTGMGQYISNVALTNDGDTITYCNAAPSGDTATFTGCTLPVTVTNTQFKVRLTAKSHALMPAPQGGNYAIGATITSFTVTGIEAGTDTGSSTTTVDNLSPGTTTGSSATPGNTQIQLSWSNPGDIDFQKVIIYCKTSAITEAPTEGTDPSVDGAVCDATARVKYSGSTSPQTFTGLTNGQIYYFRIYARDTNGNFTSYALSQVVSATPAFLGLPISGTLTSSVFDTTANSASIGYNGIMWKGTSGTGKVLFQLAASNSSIGPWNYYGGSTCGSLDWFETMGPDIPLELKGLNCFSNWNNKRYFRYKVKICSGDCSTNGSTSPIIDKIIINWSS